MRLAESGDEWELVAVYYGAWMGLGRTISLGVQSPDVCQMAI